jgi:hypothetical protein
MLSDYLQEAIEKKVSVYPLYLDVSKYDTYDWQSILTKSK